MIDPDGLGIGAAVGEALGLGTTDGWPASLPQPSSEARKSTFEDKRSRLCLGTWSRFMNHSLTFRARLKF